MGSKRAAAPAAPAETPIPVAGVAPVEPTATTLPSAALGASTPTPTAPAKAKGPVTVKYRDHKGDIVERVFSEEVHGKKFADLAEEFKTTNANACAGLND